MTLLGAYSYNPSGANRVRAHAVLTAGSNLLTYGANGNMLTRVEMSGTQRTLAPHTTACGSSAGVTYTQSWDRENRLVVVTNTATMPNAVTRFVYDGDPLCYAPRATAATA
jgi:hypothetical protein